MSKYTPKTYTVRNLTALLKKHDEVLLKGDQQRQTTNAITEEEKQLLTEADITDKKQLEKIKDVRLKKEIATNRMVSLSPLMDGLIEEIREECDAMIEGLISVLEGKAAKSISGIVGNLHCFFIGRDAQALAEAKEVFKTTNFGIKYFQLRENLNSAGLRNKSPILKARSLLDLSPKIALLEPFGEESPGDKPLWAAKTSDDHEEEELTRLLTGVGREERIELLMRSPLMNREKAEKALQGRIDHLKAEQKRRGAK